jgi:curved DNA-binding protein CbpA
MKDHYVTLCVMPQADSVVIKAAYRALAQLYHPDKWVGEPATATARMAEINEAYRVLSDPQLRAQYDRERAASATADSFDSSTDQETAFDDALAATEQRWAVAVEVFPDLAELRSSLAKISQMLAFSFVTEILEARRFDRRREIASAMEDAFLRRYFGDNPRVLAYARSLIANGLRDAAKTLNHYVDVVGSSAGEEIIARVEQVHRLSEWRDAKLREVHGLTKLIDLVEHGAEFEDGRRLATAFGFESQLSGAGYFADPSVRVTGPGGFEQHYANITAFMNWVRSQLVPRAKAQL